MEDKDKLYEGYRIKSLGTFPMFEIKAMGQGQIPTDLKGVFTTFTMAQRAIDLYLGSLIKRGKRTNGEKESVA